jgi:MSHA biogenesis protein MshI
MNRFRRLLGGGAARGWLAVEIGESSVSFAHVVPNGGRAAVEFTEERPWDPLEPKSLERAARDIGAKRYRCTTLLQPTQYQIVLVEAPPVKPDELRAAIRWRVKDMLDFHIDDATIDVLDVPVPASAGQRPRSMYAVAARNDTIRATVERFEGAGMPLAVIDIPDTAQRNLAACFEAAGRAVMALSFDQHGGLITVNYAGELYLSRRLDGGAHQHERILVEVQRSLDHCERTYPFLSFDRVLVGPPADDEGLREHLAANLYLPIEPFDLAQAVTLPGDWTPQTQAKWLKLVGAGLREEKKAL